MWVFKKHSNSLNLTCQCEKCGLDIMAIALNALPTHYSVDKGNKTYIKEKYIEKKHEVNVLSVTSKCCTNCYNKSSSRVISAN